MNKEMNKDRSQVNTAKGDQNKQQQQRDGKGTRQQESDSRNESRRNS